VKIKHIDDWNDLRIDRAAEYSQLLHGCRMVLPCVTPGYRHIFHLYVVEAENRDGLQEFLKKKGIIALTNYPIAIHQQEGFPFGAGDPHPMLPHTEWHVDRVLSLPIYPEITPSEVKYVAAACIEWEKESA